MAGILSVHDATGNLLPLIREAAMRAAPELRVESESNIDYHDAPELIVYAATTPGIINAAAFRSVVSESVACRAALIVLAPLSTDHENEQWLAAGAWSVHPSSIDARELAAHFRSALRMVHGARSAPDGALAVLRESEERHRAILETAVDGIITIDERGLIDGVNPAAAKMFGYSPGELTGTSINRLMPASYAEKHDGFLAHYLATGQKKIIGIGRAATGLRRDGTEFPIDLSVSEIRLRDRRLFTGIVRDITEKRRIENVLVRLATAVDQTAEAIVITDSTPTILYANPAFEKHTGYPVTEAQGQNPRILKSGQHDSVFYHVMWDQLAAGKVWAGHVVNRRKDGSLIDVQQVISPIIGEEGKVTNYVSVWRDVTRELQLEEQVRQAQKMESIGRLAGGIAHDFNNLLTAIIGLAGLARELIDGDHPIASYLDDMVLAARRSSKLTQQLLTFSRKHLSELRALRINDVVVEMEHLLRRSIGEDVELVTELGDGNNYFEGDSAQLGQVLMNLVVNARDAMPGGGRLLITTSRTTLDSSYTERRLGARPGAYVRLAVRDSGSGISREVMKHIFEPFFTTKEAGRGTGLGLAMVYGIVQQHHGFIEVDTEPGHGTEFRIFLPGIPPPATHTQQVSAGVAPRGHEAIMVVEDEDIVRRTTSEMLSSLGYKVVSAASGDEALAMVARGANFDLLVSDIVMPRMSGYELAMQLLAKKPALRVLLVSGFASEIAAPRDPDQAKLPMLSKPFGREELARRVREILNPAR